MAGKSLETMLIYCGASTLTPDIPEKIILGDLIDPSWYDVDMG